MNTKTKLLFICYGEPVPSSRYRAYQYYLNKKVKNSFDTRYYSINPKNVYKYNLYFKYAILIFRKIYALNKAAGADIVFLQKYPLKFMSPHYEWFIKKVLRKKIIFDFDDSIWILTGKYDKRVEKIISIADLVIVGNKYLYNYAKSYNKNVKIINTVIDTDKFKLKRKQVDSKINICWSGTKPNNHFLVGLEEVFIYLKRRYKKSVEFYFLSNERPVFMSFNDYKYLTWSKEMERLTLSRSDIGIMPLDNGEIARGKCGFKLILYGAYSLASVASPVGINKEIIRNGVNGYLADGIESWKHTLTELIDNHAKLTQMKHAARLNVVENYSLNSKVDYFVNVVSHLI